MSKKRNGQPDGLPDENSPDARARLLAAGFENFDDWYLSVRTCLLSVAHRRSIRASEVDDFVQAGLIAAWAWLMIGYKPIPNDRLTSRRKYLKGVITVAHRLSPGGSLETIPPEHEALIPDASSAATPSQKLEGEDELKLRITNCIQRLPLPEQRVLVLLYMESGMNVAQLSRALGLGYNRTRTLFINSMDHLKRCLGSDET